MLADQIPPSEWTNPHALLIVLGKFNKGNLSHTLPKCRAFMKGSTREENALNCWYTTSCACHAVPHSAQGHSDHVMVHVVPAHRWLSKLAVRIAKKWNSEAVESLGLF